MSHTTLRDFFLAALMVYGAILRLAAIHALPGQIDAFKHEKIEFRATLTSGDVAAKALADNRFHEITSDMAGNTYLRPSFHRLLIDNARISMPLSHVIQRWLPSLPMIIGTGTMRALDSIALATGAREMGADAFLLGTLRYSVPTKRDNALSALANDRAANLPVMLYNYPGRMGVNMGGEFPAQPPQSTIDAQFQAGPQQQILGRVRRQRQLGKNHDSGPRFDTASGNSIKHQLRISLDITNQGIQLRHNNRQFFHISLHLIRGCPTKAPGLPCRGLLIGARWIDNGGSHTCTGSWRYGQRAGYFHG